MNFVPFMTKNIKYSYNLFSDKKEGARKAKRVREYSHLVNNGHILEVYELRHGKNTHSHAFGKKGLSLKSKGNSSIKNKRSDSRNKHERTMKSKKSKTQFELHWKSKKVLRRLKKANSSTKDCSHKTSDKVTTSMIKETLLQRSLSQERSEKLFNKHKHRKANLFGFIEYSSDKLHDISDDVILGYRSICKMQNRGLQTQVGKQKSSNYYESKKKKGLKEYQSVKDFPNHTNYILKGKIKKTLNIMKSVDKNGTHKKLKERLAHFRDHKKKKMLMKKDYEKMTKKELVKRLMEKDMEIRTIKEEAGGSALRKYKSKTNIYSQQKAKNKVQEEYGGFRELLSRPSSTVSETKSNLNWIARRSSDQNNSLLNPTILKGMETVKRRLKVFLRLREGMTLELIRHNQQKNSNN